MAGAVLVDPVEQALEIVKAQVRREEQYGTPDYPKRDKIIAELQRVLDLLKRPPFS